MPKSTLDLAKLISLPMAYNANVSWDGSHVAFIWNVTGRMEMYVAELPDGKSRNLSRERLPRSPRTTLVWNRADRRIMFGWDNEGKERHALWSIDVQSGELTQVTDRPDVWHMPIEFSPDDSSLAFLSNCDGPRNLYGLDLKTGAIIALTAFTSVLYNAGQWSPDGTQLLASSNETKNLRNSDIYVVDATGNGIRRVYQGSVGSRDFHLGWLPDGKHIMLTSDVAGIERPGVLELETGEVRWLGQDDISETAADVSKRGRHVLSLRNQNAQMMPIITDLATGEESTLDIAPGFADRAQFALDDTAIVLGHTTPTRQIELVVAPVCGDESHSLTPVDYDTVDSNEFVEPKHITYKSSDGLSIPALLYEPRIASDDLPPAVVEIHGGPWGQARMVFHPLAQFLVAQGFVVLIPNFRGSTGYGRKFFDASYKDWGGGDLQDVVAGAEYLIREGKADPERIACFGGSYGGYMTYMAMTKAPDVWKAGVAWVGLTDLLAAHAAGPPSLSQVYELMMGDPVENEALWRDRSPIHFAENLKAKLLIIHGVNDPRCPISHARTFRDRLLKHGFVEGEGFDYVELDKIGHGSSDIEQTLHTFRTIIDFLIENV